MFLLPRAAGTVNAPPLITVPGGAVAIVRTWQMLQPTELNRLSPAIASEVAARTVSRGGALLVRMNSVNFATSTPPASSGSGTVSKAATEAPFDVFSVGWRGLVIPI